MKIANLINPGQERLQPAADDVAPDTKLYDLITKANFPMAIHPVNLAMKELVYAEAALRAEADGADAIFINSVADYGIELVRGTVGIPVVGAGEAAIAAAKAIGGKFSIVSVWPASAQVFFDKIIQANQVEDACVSVRYVLDADDVAAMGGAAVMDSVERPDGEVADRVLRTCRDAVELDGAEMIVLGCTCMAGLTDFLRDGLDVPVVDALHAGWTAVESAARDHSLRTGERPDADTAGRVQAAVEAMLTIGVQSTEDDCGDVCSVLAH